MPDLQEIILNFFIEGCRPLKNCLRNAYIDWRAGAPFQILHMTKHQATERVNMLQSRGDMSWQSRKGVERPWDEVFSAMFLLADTFYTPTVNQMGIFYEQWIRSLIGIHLFIWQHKADFGENSIEALAVKSPHYLQNAKERCLTIWALPNRIRNPSQVEASLQGHTNMIGLLEFFLANAPFMKAAYNARDSSGMERVSRVVAEEHYDNQTGLLYYLTHLIQELCMSITRSGKFSLMDVNESPEYRSKFPDSEGDIQYVAEYGLDVRAIVVADHVQQIHGDIRLIPGFQSCAAEVIHGGTRTAKTRVQIVQLCIMANVFPSITKQFFDYWARQKQTNRRFDSFYARTKIQEVIFSDRLVGQTITPSNHDLLKHLLHVAPTPLGVVHEEIVYQQREEAPWEQDAPIGMDEGFEEFAPLEEEESTYAIGIAIVLLVVFVMNS